MPEVLQCLKKYGQRLDIEIAEELRAPLATVRGQIAELRASGAVVTCKLTRYEGTKTIEAWACRVSVRAQAGAGAEGGEGGVMDGRWGGHGTFAMSDTVTLIVGHRLGKAEAVRRLKEGLARSHGQLGPMIAVEPETWQGDTVRFALRALGQTATANIEVLEEITAHRRDVALVACEGGEAAASDMAQASDAAAGEEVGRRARGLG